MSTNGKAIPRVIHYVWISSDTEMHETSFQNIFNTYNLTKQDSEKWELNLWVDKKTKDQQIVRKLQNIGFNINDISCDGNKASDSCLFSGLKVRYPIHNKYLIDTKLSKAQEEMFDSSLYKGVKIDLVKYQILKKHGGIVSDINFSLQTLPQDEHLAKGLILHITSQYTQTGKSIENCFMGSYKIHPFFFDVQIKIFLKKDDYQFCFDSTKEHSREVNGLYLLYMKTVGDEAYKGMICASDLTTQPLNEVFNLREYPATLSEQYQLSCEEMFVLALTPSL